MKKKGGGGGGEKPGPAREGRKDKDISLSSPGLVSMIICSFGRLSVALRPEKPA